MTRNPTWNYTQQHRIADLTDDVVHNLKTGNISLMIYAYPAARATIKEDATTKKAAQRRFTSVYDKDEMGKLLDSAEEEARLEGLELEAGAESREDSINDVQ